MYVFSLFYYYYFVTNNTLKIVYEYTYVSWQTEFQWRLTGKNEWISWMLIKKNGKIIFNLHKKLTNSGYLHFHSNHPIEHKKGVILNFSDSKQLLLSHPLFQTKNLEEIKNLLINNGYLLEFIFSTINNRIKQFSVSGIKQRCKEYLNEDSNNWPIFTIPYVKNISEKFRRISKKHDPTLAFSTYNSLSKFIKTGKNQLNQSSCCDVVYQINCRDCEAGYVGQTKRLLQTRIKKHFKNIKKSLGLPSVISDHRLEYNHQFKWNEVRILDEEPSWNKRILSEMIYFKKQHCGINKQSDTNFCQKIIFL